MNRQDLDAIRHQMKDRHITVSFLASFIDRSPSWVGKCLNGHYPSPYAHEKGTALLPYNIERALRRFNISFTNADSPVAPIRNDSL